VQTAPNPLNETAAEKRKALKGRFLLKGITLRPFALMISLTRRIAEGDPIIRSTIKGMNPRQMSQQMRRIKV
jgi:hypothetical protein